MKPTAPGGLQEKWIIPILREVAEAIFWVHKAGIIHRDIKCANVLITEAGSVQLCDFGVSGIIETRFDKRSTFIGTPHWMAPELFDPSASYVSTLSPSRCVPLYRPFVGLLCLSRLSLQYADTAYRGSKSTYGPSGPWCSKSLPACPLM